MSKGDQRSTNNASNKPIAGPKDPVEGGAKPAANAKTKRGKAAAERGKSSPKAKNKPKPERLAPQAIPRAMESDPERHADENPASQIEHPTSEITNMEVHHHPQLDHKPKPIKEYLLEGFMIFIAVMMGFIAENIRETISNNEHVQQLTAQLV